jgi:hypothetical protein
VCTGFKRLLGKVQWLTPVKMVMNLRGYIMGEEFIDQLSDYKLLKKDYASCFV